MLKLAAVLFQLAWCRATIAGTIPTGFILARRIFTITGTIRIMSGR